MVNKALRQIILGTDVKGGLLELKEELRKASKEGLLSEALLIVVKTGYDRIIELLGDEDPKNRKNAAQILKYIKDQSSAEALFNAYMYEEINYVRASYLEALAELDHSAYDGQLNFKRIELSKSEITDDNRKHICEEMRQLNSMLINRSRHVFSGYDMINELVLLTNRNFKSLTAKQLDKIPHKEFTAGVMAKTRNLKAVLQVRTYQEILFVPDGIGVSLISSDPLEGARQLIDGHIYDYINDRHDATSSPYYFRVDLRCKDEKQKAWYEKKIAAELELRSGWKLINSTGDYEIEIRLVESGDGYNVLIRFCTLPDHRFEYRRETISAGMKPYIAALISSLAAPYIKNNSAVIDPFCGAGTLLVERDRVLPYRLAYGVDIFGEAVIKAGINIKAAGIASKTELVTRNFFDFKHSYKFNEVITDMPFTQ